MTLFTRPGCPYSPMVINKLDDLGIDYDCKDTNDSAVVKELREKGGDNQVPYLYDDEKGAGLYESHDIVDYLDTHYGEKKATEESV